MLDLLAIVVLVLMCVFVVHEGIPGHDPRVRVRRLPATRPSAEHIDGFGGAKAYDSSVTFPGMYMKGPIPILGSKGQNDEQETQRDAEKAHQ